MGQPSELLCLRKRMKLHGYFDIHIKKDKDDFWIVSACEPLGGFRITVKQKGFDKLFRKKMHGGGFVYLPASKPFDSLAEFTNQQVNENTASTTSGESESVQLSFFPMQKSRPE